MGREFMNSIGEGLGAAVEGGMVAHLVEPTHGKAEGQAPEPAACANCGTLVIGHFCAECGQKAYVHRSLAMIGHDIIHGVLHLDGKLWNTLPLLVFKPGELTHRYISGERAKFVSPMAMFLFSVFAMFAVFQMVGLSAPTDLPTEIIDASTGDRPAELDFGATGIEWLDQGIISKWKKNPSLMLYKLQSNGYKFSWLLIPLSIPFVWLLFAWRRRYHAYDHAAFVTYSLAFMSLLFIAVSLISVSPLGSGWAAALLFLGGPVHLYKQLRHTYSLNRFSALWRFCVLLLSITIVQTLFLQVLLVLGAF